MGSGIYAVLKNSGFPRRLSRFRLRKRRLQRLVVCDYLLLGELLLCTRGKSCRRLDFQHPSLASGLFPHSLDLLIVLQAHRCHVLLNIRPYRRRSEFAGCQFGLLNDERKSLGRNVLGITFRRTH